MRSTFSKKGLRTLTVLSLLQIGLMQGCSTASAPEKDYLTNIGASPAQARAFEKILRDAADDVDQLNMKNIPLRSEDDEKWFQTLAFRYWSGRISSTRFLHEGKTRYPKHEKSLIVYADRLNARP